MRNSIFLAFILLAAFCMAFIPHIGYAYPLHVDEWMHMTYAQTIAQTGSITFPDPFSGLTNINLGDNLWVGFHTLWAMFQQVSGIDWITLFRYFPSIMFMIIVLAVYVLASRQGYGLEAAFFTCLIPTTGGLLGPAFMVPMALGMLFVPLSMFLAFTIKKWPSYLLIFLFTCFLLASHATTAVVLCIILAPYILLNLKDNKWHAAGVFAALVLPFALTLPWTFPIAVQSISRLQTPQYYPSSVELPDLLWKFGLLPAALSFLGMVILLVQSNKKGLAFILGLAALLAVMFVFVRLHHGLITVYERGLTVMLLILSVLAGAGLSWLRKLKLPANFLNMHRSILARSTINVGCLLLVAVILVIAVPARLNAVFYHMIDDEDYRAFTWTKDNIGKEYTTALLDPWKATAFAAITDKSVSSRIWISQEQIDGVIYKFLENGCRDTTFLRDFRGSLVYNLTSCDNPDLIAVRNHIYITNPNILDTASQNNLVRNAEFEAIYGTPPLFWSTYSQSCTATFTYPQPGRGTGLSAGIRVEKITGSDPLPAAVWFQHVPVQAGRSYTVGGWMRTENISGQGAMMVPQWKGPGYSWIGSEEFMPNIQGTSGWTYYQGKVTAPPGATFCGVTCIMTNCTGSSWFDDIEFRQE